MKKYSKYISFLLVSVSLIILDQITKYLAVKNLKAQSDYPVIKDILEFKYLENTGAAWGIFGGKRFVFMIFTIIVLIFLIFALFRIEKVLWLLENKKAGIALQWVMVFLIAGAIGNFIDRIRLGYVIDFIYFKLIDFPVFNVADCYVTISTMGILFLLLTGISESDWNLIFSKKKSGGESGE